MPPSAMMLTPASLAAAAHSRMAVSCGTPAPVTERVVQTLPGPMPTLITLAPAFARSSTPSGVATLPATIGISPRRSLTLAIAAMAWVEWPWAMSRVRKSTSQAASPAARCR